MQVIFPGGDGWLRAFEAKTGKLLWKFDCNPKKADYKAGGRGDANYIIATPVVRDNKVYVAIGQDPEDGSGVGHLWCIDITKEPKNKDKDLSPRRTTTSIPKAAVNKDSGLVWHYGGRSATRPTPAGKSSSAARISTVAIHDGLLYAAELDGYLHCLDAKTGEKYWEYRPQGRHLELAVLCRWQGVRRHRAAATCTSSATASSQKPPKKIDMREPLKVPPVAVNGVLYINNGTHLYAIAAK